MSCYLSTRPQVLAFLHDAKEKPDEDAPRLVLADYLEDQGDPRRGEFIRLQCRLAAGAPPVAEAQRKEIEGRCERLLDRHGGCWLGPV
jgi:uncharacterized protein (TIGR02996 family)